MLAHFIIKLQKHAGEEGKHPLNLNMMGEGPHFFLTQSRTENSLGFTSWGHLKDSIAGQPVYKGYSAYHTLQKIIGFVVSLSIGLKPITSRSLCDYCCERALNHKDI